MSGIAAELNRTRTPGAHAMNWAHLPSEFVIDDYPLTKIAVVRVFMGKASPDEIKDVIWLAHRNGIITNAAAPTPRPG